jgi:glycosyltransferase involved in cell wall biosynthesis
LQFCATLQAVRVLVDYRPALRERTGVGEYVHELVRALVRHGDADEVAVFTSSWKDRPSPDVALDLVGAVMVDRQLPGRVLTAAWNRLAWPPIEWLAGRFDVVHAATPVAIPSRSAAVVLTIHDLHFLRHPERMAAEMRRDFPNLVRAHARRAPAIVVSSAYTAADVHHTLDVPAERIHLCRPGAPAWADAVRLRRRTEAREHILFLGTLDPRKNIGVLLAAYRQLRAEVNHAPRLVLAGGVPSSAAAWQSEAAAPDLAGHVSLAGYVSQARRMDLFARAHLLVLPSLDEGFGLPVLEAMACGVPVVVSSGGSLPEVAGDAATPIAAGDVDGFAAAMAALLDPDVAREAIARGLARAATFSWGSCARQARRAYSAAMEHRP